MPRLEARATFTPTGGIKVSLNKGNTQMIWTKQRSAELITKEPSVHDLRAYLHGGYSYSTRRKKHLDNKRRILEILTRNKPLCM